MVLTVHTPAAGDEPDNKKQKMDVNEQPALPPTAETNTQTQDTKGDLMPSLPSLPTDDASQPAAAAATSNASTATTLPLPDEEQTQRKSPELGNSWKCAGCGLNENECNTPLLLFEDPEEVDTAGKEGEGSKECDEEKR